MLDRLLSKMLEDLDERAEQLESTWEISSVDDFVSRELNLHIDYYETHPSYVQLWFGGRISQTVVTEVRARNRTLAGRARTALIQAGFVDPKVPDSAFLMLVEIGDRILDLAFRDRATADPEIIEHGRRALRTYLEQLATPKH